MATYKYSRWDGTQQVFEIDEDSLLESLSDDILGHGDVSYALRSLFQRGIREDDRGQRIEGLRDLMERLKRQRQQLLERYNLESLVDDLHERLRDVIDTELKGIDRRLEEAGRQLAEAAEQADHLQSAMGLLEQRATQSKETLDNLPQSTAGAIRELGQYDFMDPEARRKYDELLDLLKQKMLQFLFQHMRQQLQDVSAEDMRRLGEMVRDLNRMLKERATGLEPDFDGFMERHGDLFDPDRPSSLDELIERLQRQMAAMQSLMQSMSPEMRGDLDSLLESVADPDLMRELEELAAQMYGMFPFDDLGREYPFMGDEPVTLDQAMELMGDLQDLDELDQKIQRVMRSGSIEDLDLDQVEEHLGEEARQQVERLQQIVQQLEKAGYLKRRGERLGLTPRGIRKLAQQALRQVFSELKKERLGRHEVHQRGDAGERTGETRAFEFGDSFDIDLHRTLFNAVVREGARVPVRLSPEDLEIHRTEHMTQVATVLLLDQSRSMGMFGGLHLGQEGRFGAVRADPIPVPARLLQRDRLFGLRHGNPGRRPRRPLLERLGLGYKHAPRPYAIEASPVQAKGGDQADSDDHRRRAHRAPGERTVLLQLPSQLRHG